MRFLEHTISEMKNQPEGWFEWSYVAFNWFEALGWISFAWYVWWRGWKGQGTAVEFFYGLAFLLFGITDVIEVYKLTLGLFLVKARLLLGLVLLRNGVVPLYAPRKLYL